MAIQAIQANKIPSFGKIKQTKLGNEYNSTHMTATIFGTIGAIWGLLPGMALAAETKASKFSKFKIIAAVSAGCALLATFPIPLIIDAFINNSRKNRADENARTISTLMQKTNNAQKLNIVSK